MWPGILILIGVVAVFSVLLVLAGRRGEGAAGPTVGAVSMAGLHLDGVDRPVPWSAIFEVTVLTRRELRQTWYGFEIRTEGHGLVTLDGTRGPGREFLAECHRFDGFDHRGLGQALQQRGSRVVCFSR